MTFNSINTYWAPMVGKHFAKHSGWGTDKDKWDRPLILQELKVWQMTANVVIKLESHPRTLWRWTLNPRWDSKLPTSAPQKEWISPDWGDQHKRHQQRTERKVEPKGLETLLIRSIQPSSVPPPLPSELRACRPAPSFSISSNLASALALCPKCTTLKRGRELSFLVTIKLSL